MRTHFRSRHYVLALLAVAAFSVGAAGCGDDYGGGDDDDETLSKAEVIERGSAICKAQERKVLALPQLTSQNPFAEDARPGEAEQAEKFLGGYADALQATRTQLGELELPDEDKAIFESFLEELGLAVAKLRAAERAAARRDPQAIMLANEGFALFDQASKKTAAYGFPNEACRA